MSFDTVKGTLKEDFTYLDLECRRSDSPNEILGQRRIVQCRLIAGDIWMEDARTCKRRWLWSWRDGRCDGSSADRSDLVPEESEPLV